MSNTERSKTPMLAALVVPESFQNNRIFDDPGRDNANNRFIILRDKLKAVNIQLDTQDINSSHLSALQIYIDVPPSDRRKSSLNAKAKKILIVSESPIICPGNQDEKYRNKMDRILTWETNKHDGKTFWIGCGCSFIQDIEDQNIYSSKHRKGICMIVGNKKSRRRAELYSSRIKAIKFFEKSSLNFDLYGVGWDHRVYTGALRPLNKLSITRKSMHRPPPSFRGKIDSKFETLKQYNFSIAYENASSSNGYITEKVFDSIFSGCIPIYKGSSDITNYLPEDIYINANNIDDLREIENIIKSMTDNELRRRHLAMHEFTQNFKQTSFYDQTWSNEVARHCKELLDLK